jgi:anti-sigma regulatory factor (Ser/Thr protein kinase)
MVIRGNERVHCLRLEPNECAPRLARRHVWFTTCDWGLTEQRLCELELLVSETVTNAIVHAGTPVDLSLRLDDGLVSVAVRDFGDGIPSIRGTPSTCDSSGASGGWGMRLIAGVSTRWGVAEADPGKVVWFELARR